MREWTFTFACAGFAAALAMPVMSAWAQADEASRPLDQSAYSELSGVTAIEALECGSRLSDASINAPRTGEVATRVSPSLQTARRHRLDPDLGTVLFRNMDALYNTRPVAKGQQVWALPADARPLPDSYRFEGTVRPVEEGLERSKTDALLIIRDGVIVHEQYRNNAKPDDRFVSFSMAKSIISLLLGAAIETGSIESIDDPVTRYFPELQGSALDGVSIRQVAQMRSGTDWHERYDYLGEPSFAAKVSELVLVKECFRLPDVALHLNQAEAPGKKFNYSSIDTAVLGRVISRATGQKLADFTREQLWEPLGSEADAYWLLDGAGELGEETAPMGFNARLRDYGRLGQMVLANGAADGRQIVSPDWIEQSTAAYKGGGTPVAGAMDYAYHWWIPKDSSAVSAVGFGGQYIYIDRATGTVIVKLSHDVEAARNRPEALAILHALARAVY